MRPRFTGFRRHLEGWEQGALTVGVVILCALLLVPRPVRPDELPVPKVDRREQRRDRALDRERAARARAERLPYDVRAVGELFRRCGTLLAMGSDAQAERAALVAQAESARAAHGNEGLLRLRALQTEFFLEALRGWEETGETSTELGELGGDFLAKARRSAWIVDPRRLVLAEEERRLLFRARWNELAGLRQTHPFALSLNDWRAYYRVLLEHPELDAHAPDAASAAHAQLRYVTALSRRDPDFPAALALGILHYRLGDHAKARAALSLHNSRHPHGPWRLRARNYLRAALDPRP